METILIVITAGCLAFSLLVFILARLSMKARITKTAAYLQRETGCATRVAIHQATAFWSHLEFLRSEGVDTVDNLNQASFMAVQACIESRFN